MMTMNSTPVMFATEDNDLTKSVNMFTKVQVGSDTADSLYGGFGQFDGYKQGAAATNNMYGAQSFPLSFVVNKKAAPTSSPATFQEVVVTNYTKDNGQVQVLQTITLKKALVRVVPGPSNSNTVSVELCWGAKEAGEASVSTASLSADGSFGNDASEELVANPAPYNWSVQTQN